MINDNKKNLTSGNEFIDKFIQETKNNINQKLFWIPYNNFKNVEYLDKGGFSTIYKATFFNRSVALKSINDLNSLNENLNEFLNEWKYHNKCITGKSIDVIKQYGFTQDPNTSNYMVVMDYAKNGSLRKCLAKIVKVKWNIKLFMLSRIIIGLNQIHQQDLIHCDLHDGNILNYDAYYITRNRPCISDLGLCKPVGSSKTNDIYGVIPFMAPEVLRGKPYTLASDVYSCSMIMWEYSSGVPPFNDRAHDLQLCLSICRGERPEIIENTPQCYVDLMKKCWDENPLKRPSASEVSNIVKKWIEPGKFENISKELKNNIMEFIKADDSPNSTTSNNKPHPQAFRISQLLDFTKNLNNILEQEEKEIYDSLEALKITEEDIINKALEKDREAEKMN